MKAGKTLAKTQCREGDGPLSPYSIHSLRKETKQCILWGAAQPIPVVLCELF